MKKLFLMTMVLLAAAACSRDEMTGPAAPGGQDATEPPHFYGMAMLDNEAPQTRGVANQEKLWTKSMAEDYLTVKFLNGIQEYQDYVKVVAQEWEKAAGVRFHFIENDQQDAMIRIGFDYVRGMQTSWSYTGRDNLQLYDQQSEPTMHFAQWRRISDEKRRSDVLRAFGQALGLELEFRHPIFYPAWKSEEGVIDEAYIRDYWENELAGFIAWEELKKMVLDPINLHARFIAKTDEYDENSVMTWPFYDEVMGRNIKTIKFDADYKTELSELDKAFIFELYGESLHDVPKEGEYLPLIEFNYTGTAPAFTVSTKKNLVVIWDAQARDVATHIELPTDTTTLYTTTVRHTYTDSKTRKIVIGEKLEYAEEMPQTSTALTKFDFTNAVGAEDIQIFDRNLALSYTRIYGGAGFKSQKINFAARNCFKEVYLTQTNNSNGIVDNCRNLEIFATTPFIWKPTVSGPQLATIKSQEVNGYYETEGPFVVNPGRPIRNIWPYNPISTASLDTVDIRNCPNLKVISLENTRIKKLELIEHDNLEYIYLSSFADGIVGGGNYKGDYLRAALMHLPDRSNLDMGLIVIRGLKYNIPVVANPTIPTGEAGTLDPDLTHLDNTAIIYRYPVIYTPVRITLSNFAAINRYLTDKNWRIVWDSGLQVVRI